MKKLPPSGRPLKAEEKRTLALMLLQQAGDLAEFFSEKVEVHAPDGGLAQVSAEDAAWQLSRWLRHLPGPDWDTRLPYPEV